MRRTSDPALLRKRSTCASSWIRARLSFRKWPDPVSSHPQRGVWRFVIVLPAVDLRSPLRFQEIFLLATLRRVLRYPLAQRAKPERRSPEDNAGTTDQRFHEPRDRAHRWLRPRNGQA